MSPGALCALGVIVSQRGDPVPAASFVGLPGLRASCGHASQISLAEIWNTNQLGSGFRTRTLLYQWTGGVVLIQMLDEYQGGGVTCADICLFPRLEGESNTWKLFSGYC